VTAIAFAFLTAAGPVKWLIAAALLAVTDLCWAFYVNNAGKSPRSAAWWAVALFLLGGMAVVGYTAAPVLLIPSAIGAWIGTYIGCRVSQKDNLMKKLDLTEFWSWLAWKLPRGLVYWCAIRLMTHSASVLYREEMPAITCVDAITAWDTPLEPLN
jgi:hypothetical protein